MNEENATKQRATYRTVRADLVEAMPEQGGLSHWILASPMLLFLAWLWVDFFHLLSPLENRLLNVFLGALVYIGLIILPFGLLTHRLILAFPRLFHNAGWDIQPLEPVKPEEIYLVRYQYQRRHWAAGTWPRRWLRAAQGWVYLEIILIFVGAIAMIPLFFSAVEFGFGQ